MHCALLVIDVQNGVVGTCHERDRTVGNISAVLGYARHKGMPVIFVQHTNDQELPEHSDQWNIVPELMIQATDVRLTKRYNSAFEDTGLEEVLKGLGTEKLLVVGAATNWCIRATVFGALTKGYHVMLVSDAHTTESMKLSADRTIKAEDIIEEFNIGVKYVEFSRVKTEVLTTQELLST